MIQLDRMLPQDWERVRTIYEEGIETGNATFAEAVPTWEAWDRDHLQAARIVAREGSAVVGWAALAATSNRSCYCGVVEVSVYVAAASRGKGVGLKLLTGLVAESELLGFWTLQAGIFPENSASIALHTRCGFRIVGTREKLGCMRGTWRDVVLMERRSLKAEG